MLAARKRAERKADRWELVSINPIEELVGVFP